MVADEAYTWLLTTGYWFVALYGIACAIAVIKKGHVGATLWWVMMSPFLFNAWAAYGEPGRGTVFVGKFLRSLLKCPVCVGFWISIAVSALLHSPAAGLGIEMPLAVFLDAFAAAGAIFVVHACVMGIAPKGF